MKKKAYQIPILLGEVSCQIDWRDGGAQQAEDSIISSTPKWASSPLTKCGTARRTVSWPSRWLRCLQLTVLPNTRPFVMISRCQIRSDGKRMKLLWFPSGTRVVDQGVGLEAIEIHVKPMAGGPLPWWKMHVCSKMGPQSYCKGDSRTG